MHYNNVNSNGIKNVFMCMTALCYFKKLMLTHRLQDVDSLKILKLNPSLLKTHKFLPISHEKKTYHTSQSPNSYGIDARLDWTDAIYRWSINQ